MREPELSICITFEQSCMVSDKRNNIGVFQCLKEVGFAKMQRREAFNIRYESVKTKLCNTKIEKLIIGNYLLLYNELTNTLS